MISKLIRNIIYIVFGIYIIFLVYGCRKIELVNPTEYETVDDSTMDNEDIIGLYLLNEGGAVGTNKSTIDYMDFRTSIYARNIYTEKNPTLIQGLGDVACDIQIYQGKLYIVVSGSNKVEVLDAYTGKKITQINIPNCRYIRFDHKYAYVSAYVAPIAIDPNAQRGALYKINLATYEIAGKCTVGYQPDQLEIMGNYAFVANSGRYREPNYDNTVSAVEMESMRQLYEIEVGLNLHRIKADKYKQLWVSSRGNYNDVTSNLYLLEESSNRYKVSKKMNIPVSDMTICGDSLYAYSVEYSYITNKNTVSYAIVNVKEKKIVSRKIINDGTDLDIVIPNGIIVHPVTRDIYIADAKNYESSGVLHCYSKQGIRKWSVRTGDLPAQMAFLNKKN